VLCQICKALGAKVIGTTSTPDKAQAAKRMGADEVIFYTEKDVRAEVQRITDGKGCQVVYDGVGKSTFDASLDCVAHRGWLVCYGNASGKPEPFDILRLTKGSKTLIRPTLFDFVRTKEEFDKSTCFNIKSTFHFTIIFVSVARFV
jgi:NADPH2:quinone reductase